MQVQHCWPGISIFKLFHSFLCISIYNLCFKCLTFALYEYFLLQWAVTASIDYSLAELIAVIILLSTGGKNGGGFEASKYVIIGLHGGILFLHALINSLPISYLSFLGQLAAAWNVFGKEIILLTRYIIITSMQPYTLVQ